MKANNVIDFAKRKKAIIQAAKNSKSQAEEGQSIVDAADSLKKQLQMRQAKMEFEKIITKNNVNKERILKERENTNKNILKSLRVR